MRDSRLSLAGEPCLFPIKAAKKHNLFNIARAGNLKQLKRHMRSSVLTKVEDMNQRDERQCTPLHYAAKNSHKQMIQFLIDKGADISAHDKHGWSVLQYAVRYAKMDAVKLLLDLGW